MDTFNTAVHQRVILISEICDECEEDECNERCPYYKLAMADDEDGKDD